MTLDQLGQARAISNVIDICVNCFIDKELLRTLTWCFKDLTEKLDQPLSAIIIRYTTGLYMTR